MSKAAYLPPASTAYLMLEVWGETIAGRTPPKELTIERRKNAASRVSTVSPHVFSPVYGYGEGPTTNAPYSGPRRQRAYKRADDPDVRCFMYLQVEEALLECDGDYTGEYRAWAELRFVLGTRRITGGQRREREVIKTIRRQLFQAKPETIADKISWDAIDRLRALAKARKEERKAS